MSSGSLPKVAAVTIRARGVRPSSFAFASDISSTAAAFRQAGWDAYTLAGGLQAWVDHGLPLDPADGEVAEPRPGT